MVTVRAVYRDGKFQPLEAIDLPEGQEVQLHIVQRETALKDVIGDMLVHFPPSDDETNEAAVIETLDQALKDKRPLSEIIIEERREGR